ncbi:MAG TPA: TraR/DksA C4-type zinc finger protein [Trebonia sp.]|nr:TraR/DksA C4-type zinc finger protein [Trebonia sp.]
MTDPGPAKLRLAADRDETLDRLAELEREFAAIVTSASEGSAGGDDEHDPEGATVAFERQHIAALAAQARDHLAAIDAAVAKIVSGVYEICDMCGGEIGEERLAARPSSLICVRCAARRR